MKTETLDCRGREIAGWSVSYLSKWAREAGWFCRLNRRLIVSERHYPVEAAQKITRDDGVVVVRLFLWLRSAGVPVPACLDIEWDRWEELPQTKRRIRHVGKLN